MPIAIQNGSIDLRELRLPSAQVDFLVERLGTDHPMFDQIDHLALDRGLTGTQQNILQGLQATIRGTTRGDSGKAITQAGEQDLLTLRATTLRHASLPVGESPAQAKLRQDMQAALIGQEQATDAFVRLLGDFESPQRFSPPLLVMVGDEGHGKDQAVQGDADATSTTGEVVEVDLGHCHAATDPATLFGEGQKLSREALMAKAVAGTTVVWLRHATGLAERAPQIASELARLVFADRHVENAPYVRLKYLLDFDAAEDADAKALAMGALGKAANRKVSAVARFKHLEPETMTHYARTQLREIFKATPELRPHALEYGEDALALLGQAVATPYAPLYELKDRLYHLVLSPDRLQLDRLQHPNGASLCLSVATAYARDPEKRERALAELRRETPDFAACSDLFLVTEVAKLQAPDPARQELIEAGRELTDRIAPVLGGLAANR